ncbi:MAG TPA: restriction endonuclease subunit S [Caldisericia bacterium]|nr:restriction endonuclease subunit S [Caldisericia bacterium]HPM45057.1 restriction endonuclease subunit S [Caldisericia bacterium]
MSTEQNKSAKLEGAGGEWQEKTLGEILILQRGFDLPETDRQLGRYLVIASNGPVGKHSKAMVKGPGVVIGRSGNLGGGQYIKEDFWPLNTTLWVKDFKNNDIRFCYYLLKSLDLSSFNSGSGVPTLNRNHIHPLPVSIPNRIEEQRAIAHILGTLDDKIELNRRTNETLEAMAQALFKFWFVDFGPVRAKMEGRWRRGQSLPGLPAHLFDLFPDQLVDSELGEIPEGWEVVKVSDIGKIVCGKTPSTKIPEYYGIDISFITIPDMHNNIFATTTQKKLSYLGANSQKNKTLPPNTICVSCIATPGLVIITTENSQTNQQINSVILDELNEIYYWFWIFRNLNNIIKASGSGGSVLINLSTSRFSELRILSSAKKLRQLYHLCIMPFFERVLMGLQENITLTILRDTLLPKLISGELRVRK